MSEETENILDRLSGRARFLRDRGDLKTSDLLEEAWCRIVELEKSLALQAGHRSQKKKQDRTQNDTGANAQDEVAHRPE